MSFIKKSIKTIKLQNSLICTGHIFKIAKVPVVLDLITTPAFMRPPKLRLDNNNRKITFSETIKTLPSFNVLFNCFEVNYK